MNYRFEVPGAPVPKGRSRTFMQKGRLVTTTPPETRRYEQKVKLCAYSAGVKPLQGEVALLVTFYLPDRRRRDGDNLQKAISDALNGVAYADDSQVTEWHGTIAYDKSSPRAVVWVGERVTK